MSEAPVKVTARAGVALVTIDNPPVNALNAAVWCGLEQAARDCARPGVRVIVMTGTGERAFVAGADIKEFEQIRSTPGGADERLALAHEVFGAWAALPQPVIAAVQSPAIGGGLELALLCDLIVADPSASFGLPEVKLGLIAGAGGNTRLAQRVGPGQAKLLGMLGDSIDAERALQIGLVDQVAAAGNVIGEALQLAEEIASRPAVAVQMVKRAINSSLGAETQKGLDMEMAAYKAARGTHDAEEGVRAFLDRREPRFRHC